MSFDKPGSPTSMSQVREGGREGGREGEEENQDD
jgi:hypothetical protein